MNPITIWNRRYSKNRILFAESTVRNCRHAAVQLTVCRNMIGTTKSVVNFLTMSSGIEIRNIPRITATTVTTARIASPLVATSTRNEPAASSPAATMTNPIRPKMILNTNRLSPCWLNLRQGT